MFIDFKNENVGTIYINPIFIKFFNAYPAPHAGGESKTRIYIDHKYEYIDVLELPVQVFNRINLAYENEYKDPFKDRIATALNDEKSNES